MKLPKLGLGAPPGPASATRRQLALRLLRRVHLYLGLLLWPFLLLFGITGLSFNHPTVGRGLEVKQLSPAEVVAASAFRPWDAEQVASEVVAGLNAAGAKYRLSREPGARFAGFPLFAAPTERGKQVLIVSLSDGSATITERPDPAPATPTPFGDAEIKLAARDLQTLAQTLTPVLAAQHVETKGPLKPHPKVHPQLAFGMLDAGGKEWNVLYELGTGKLSGKPSAEHRSGAFVELLEAIHTQHHYPPHPSATRWWALFADLTAFTLIVWSLTGLVMWWQLRRLRLAGAVIIALAVGTSATVMLTTGAELSFTPSVAD
jgi:hypothetical protein